MSGEAPLVLCLKEIAYINTREKSGQEKRTIFGGNKLYLEMNAITVKKARESRVEKKLKE